MVEREDIKGVEGEREMGEIEEVGEGTVGSSAVAVLGARKGGLRTGERAGKTMRGREIDGDREGGGVGSDVESIRGRGEGLREERGEKREEVGMG